jgi:hypothetical protein
MADQGLGKAKGTDIGGLNQIEVAGGGHPSGMSPVVVVAGLADTHDGRRVPTSLYRPAIRHDWLGFLCPVGDTPVGKFSKSIHCIRGGLSCPLRGE